MSKYCDRHGHQRAAEGGGNCIQCGEEFTSSFDPNSTLERALTELHAAANPVTAEGAVIEPTGVDATLAERGARYGEFIDQAIITQNLKIAMQSTRNWNSLEPDMRECLDMIASKISRILNGDPTYVDSWHDIIGYTKLVEDRLTRDKSVG